ncbi:benzoate/H(+) symporter BenE family transporter [Saccharopolyspora montiporae]|nr:benzoate/H(+) symporter BenE family transporter [Saccharopolyspora sp. HNM0983]
MNRGLLENPPRPLPDLRAFRRDFGPRYALNGFIGLTFAATGPIAVVLSVGSQGGLSAAELASWVFAILFLNGLLTVLASWTYRQPLSFFWTIPGTVLVGPALAHLSWPEVVGAFLITGLLILVLGPTGWAGRLLAVVPMPIVMAMVAGAFLDFGLDLARSVVTDAFVAVPMVLAFLLLTWRSALGSRIPPIIGALLAGAAAVALAGRLSLAPGDGWLAAPVPQAPVFSWQAVAELVVPLAITVLVVQNAQGVAVLREAGHEPPTNAATTACGAWSVLSSLLGGISTCLSGPTNALLTASGERSRQYTAGIACGLLAMVAGLFAPALTRFMLGMPGAFIAALGGLAMLRVLQNSFVTAFSGRCALGALVTFVVTVSGVQVLNLGSAFWGLVVGVGVSWLLERADFPASRSAA